MAAWLDERRSEARAALASTPLPTLKDDNWRYTSLRGIDFDGFAAVSGADAAVRTSTVLGDIETAGELVQRGQDVVTVRLAEDVRARGVVLSSLDDAVETHAELVGRHLGTVLDLRDRFIAENSATWSGGGFVYVPAGVEVGLPLRLVVENPEAGARTLWRTLVVVDAGAKLTLLEELAPGEPGYLNGALELVLGDGALVDLVQTQELHHDSYHFTAARAEIARDATLRWFSLGLGGKLGKARQESRLGGPGAAVRATGLYALAERQHLDLDTSQEHAAPNATSDLAYKGALRGHARSVWRGIIKVDQGAQGTDAFQENRNLLLSGHAHADSIPGLQILANDVRCTHAATVSRVDAELLFFLMARGFARHEAEQMLVTAFYADALARIENLAVRERFAAALALRTG
jgi:Fe-S cluster assembly protein SufD